MKIQKKISTCSSVQDKHIITQSNIKIQTETDPNENYRWQRNSEVGLGEGTARTVFTGGESGDCCIDQREGQDHGTEERRCCMSVQIHNADQDSRNDR